jgi:sugar lactone lactonase YvrE
MFLRKTLSIIVFALLTASWQRALAQSGPSPAQLGKIITVATFDPTQSQLPEGVALDDEGNIYVGFYPTGQILKIAPSGAQSILATFDVGSNGGGIVGFALDKENNLYVCLASFDPATHGIWKVDQEGNTSLIAKLDPTGFPNDLVFDEKGNLFVSDSYLGAIWKVPKSGAATLWLKDPLLAPIFAYGANGVEFDRGDLFVANTDQASIVRVRPGDESSSPHAEIFVKSPALFGADGISFDVRHNVYVTSDYINKLVVVTPGGDIATLATAKDGLDFPADTYFAQKNGQRKFLFWTNGGYNFTLPSLQKMDVGIPGARLP